MRTKSRRWIGAAVLSLSLLWPLTGCSTNPATGSQDFTGLVSTAQEQEIGRRQHPQVLARFGGPYGDAALARYIDEIGHRLVAVSEAPNQPYTFTVLNDELVNAFALPGGYVYITRGLLALAENEAEVAGVLAHEIAHVVARHSAQRISQGIIAQLGAIALGIALESGDAARIAASSADVYLRGFSREHEMEADLLAARYMSRAGYDTRALVTLFTKIRDYKALQARLAYQPTEEGSDILSTHPRTEDRIAQGIALAQVTRNPNAVLGRDVYLRQIDGLLFGDDPKQGLRLGEAFIHPTLNFRFQVPPGFRLFNSSAAVRALGPRSTGIVFDGERRRDALQRAARLPMTRYLTQEWAKGITLQAVERITVNGMEAATGATRGRGPAGLVDLRLVAIRHPGGIYRFLFISPPSSTASLSEAFRRTTYSFRRPTAAELRAAQPKRLRIREVRAGETPRRLAQGMEVPGSRYEWLSVINQNALQSFGAGTPVKLVE
ncbi:MAG: M48 family metalloprotease [Magnetospiraceae bacterium]